MITQNRDPTGIDAASSLPNRLTYRYVTSMWSALENLALLAQFFFPKTSMGLDVFSFFCALSLSLVFLFLLLLVGVCLDIFIWHNQIEQNHSKVVFTFYCERKSLCDLLMCVFVYE